LDCSTACISPKSWSYVGVSEGHGRFGLPRHRMILLVYFSRARRKQRSMRLSGSPHLVIAPYAYIKGCHLHSRTKVQNAWENAADNTRVTLPPRGGATPRRRRWSLRRRARRTCRCWRRTTRHRPRTMALQIMLATSSDVIQLKKRGLIMRRMTRQSNLTRRTGFSDSKRGSFMRWMKWRATIFLALPRSH